MGGFIFISTFITSEQSELQGQLNSDEARAAQKKVFVLCKLDEVESEKRLEREMKYMLDSHKIDYGLSKKKTIIDYAITLQN